MTIDCHVHIGVDPLFYVNGWAPYALGLAEYLVEAKRVGVDRTVVFPFVSYLDLDLVEMRTGRVTYAGEFDGVPYRFENGRLLGEIDRLPPQSVGRVMPFLMADPGRLASEQVVEWEKVILSSKIFGIKIQATIIQSQIIELLANAACMLDFAEAHDLPMLIHTSIDPADMWSQCSDILRVVEARPRVRFILAHSCRFDAASLRRVNELPNAWFDCSAHLIHCECAVNNLPAVAPHGDRFPSDYTSPEKVLRDLAEAFPEKLIWGSDAPFYSYTDPDLRLESSYAREVACLDALPEDLRDRVCRINTLAWLQGKPPSQ